MRNWIALAGLVFTAACGSSGSDIKCGDGTTLDNGECVPMGSGSNVTCGAGTQLDSTGTMCVPTPPAATGAPTITMITPGHAGATGGVLFEIDGTGFAGDDVTSLNVYFGDTTPGSGGALGPCEAAIGMATPTSVTGEVPLACDISVTVTLQTNLGMATTPFNYDALVAADGFDTDFGTVGNVYLIDPYAGKAAAGGAVQDAGGNVFAWEGLTFASDGTLYGVTDGTSAGDADGVAQLVTISLTTGMVTPVGDLLDTSDNSWYVTDIKASGTTLYGWGYVSTDGETFQQGLVTIDTTSGAVTAVGALAADSFGFGGLAIDGTGNVFVAANSASATDPFGFTFTGELDQVDTGTGALTSAASLDYGFQAPISAMAFFGTTMLAAVDEGFYSSQMVPTMGQTFPVKGVTLAIVDPTASPIMSPLYQLPGSYVDEQSHISALDTIPTTISIAQKLRTVTWTDMPLRSSVLK